MSNPIPTPESDAAELAEDTKIIADLERELAAMTAERDRTIQRMNEAGAALDTERQRHLTEEAKFSLALSAEYEKRDRLAEALNESVKLQSHYATLLNQWDGGERMIFADAQAWADRLYAMTGLTEAAK